MVHKFWNLLCSSHNKKKPNLVVTFSEIDYAKMPTFIYLTFNDTVTQLFTQTNYQCSIQKKKNLRYVISLLNEQLCQNKVGQNEKWSVTVHAKFTNIRMLNLRSRNKTHTDHDMNKS